MKNGKTKKLSFAMQFIVLFGIVSLFSDMIIVTIIFRMAGV